MQRNAIYSLSVEVVAGYHDPWETGRRRMGTGQREEEDGDRSNIDARFCSYAWALSLMFDLSLVSLPLAKAKTE
jgi:hypothetical protein